MSAGGAAQPPLPQTASHSWTEHMTPEGLRYYYNTSTGTSSWDRPPELASAGGRVQAVPPLPPIPAGGQGAAGQPPAASTGGGAVAGGLEQAMEALTMGPGAGGGSGSYAAQPTVSAGTGYMGGSGTMGALGGLPSLPGLGSMPQTNGDGLATALGSGSGEQSSVLISEWPGGTAELRQAFSRFGTITFCEADAGSGSARVTFDGSMTASHAVDMMNGLAVGDKKLHVSLGY